MRVLRVALPFALGVALTLFVSGCSADPVDPGEDDPAEVVAVTDLPADPTDAVDSEGRPLPATGRFTLFSLRENKTIPNADSATARWDLGFRATEIIVNGGSSGPGNGAAQVAEGVFEDIVQAPTEGWKQDLPAKRAIPTGSGNGWYNYNAAAFIISPIPGRVILVRTADEKYAKVKILSYYKGAPDPVDPFEDSERYYTFDFLFQPDGSTRLE